MTDLRVDARAGRLEDAAIAHLGDDGGAGVVEGFDVDTEAIPVRVEAAEESSRRSTAPPTKGAPSGAAGLPSALRHSMSGAKWAVTAGQSPVANVA